MTDRPNVLLILTDQQRWDTLGAYGSPMDLTPNLDAMADRGTKLEHLFTPQPVCAPARGCLQTGQVATEHGVFTNCRPLADMDRTVATELSEAGYETGYIGKWHLASSGPPLPEDDPRPGGYGRESVPEESRGGYGFWRGVEGGEMITHPYEGFVYDEDGERVPYDGYRVDAFTEFAQSFVRQNREDPFFLCLSYVEPHQQNDLERYVAPEGYDQRYSDPYVPPDLEGQGGYWQSELPDYYGMIRRIDECVGRLLEELDRQDLREETVVLFLSDHGCHFGTRNSTGKMSCHEASIRVPGVIEGPGFHDRQIDALTSLLDVPATVLDLAGRSVPEWMDGRSLLSLLDGNEADWREDVFVQISESELGRALRTDRWKYSVYDPTADPKADSHSDTYVERYLYDLDADPAERRNLVGREAYREVADRLRSLLRDRIDEYEGREATIRRREYFA